MTGPRLPREYPTATDEAQVKSTLGPDVPDLLRELAIAAIPIFLAWLTRILARK